MSLSPSTVIGASSVGETASTRSAATTASTRIERSGVAWAVSTMVAARAAGGLEERAEGRASVGGSSCGWSSWRGSRRQRLELRRARLLVRAPRRAAPRRAARSSDGRGHGAWEVGGACARAAASELTGDGEQRERRNEEGLHGCRGWRVEEERRGQVRGGIRFGGRCRRRACGLGGLYHRCASDCPNV